MLSVQVSQVHLGHLGVLKIAGFRGKQSLCDTKNGGRGFKYHQKSIQTIIHKNFGKTKVN